MTAKELTELEFSLLALNEGMHIVEIAGEENALFKEKAEFTRKLNNYEKYVSGVGYYLAHLFTLCQQLQDAVHFLSLSPPVRMKEKGITKYSYLHYNIENYIIRTQSLLDRVLFLIDSIYELHIKPRNINYTNVSKHLINHPMVCKRIQHLKILLEKYHFQRTTIVHYGQFQEENLRRLEGYMILINDSDKSFKYRNPVLTIEIPKRAKILSRKILKESKVEFSKYNVLLFNSVKDILEICSIQYMETKERLSKTTT